jgi:hypothetical protein
MARVSGQNPQKQATPGDPIVVACFIILPRRCAPATLEPAAFDGRGQRSRRGLRGPRRAARAEWPVRDVDDVKPHGTACAAGTTIPHPARARGSWAACARDALPARCDATQNLTRRHPRGSAMGVSMPTAWARVVDRQANGPPGLTAPAVGATCTEDERNEPGVATGLGAPFGGQYAPLGSRPRRSGSPW